MKHANKVVACFSKLCIREVYRILDSSLLDIVDKLVSRHCCAVVLRLRCGSAKVWKNDNILLAKNNIICKVCYILCNLSVLDSLYNSRTVDKLASCKVDKTNAVLHHCYLSFVDSVLCVRCIRNVDSDIIAILVDIVDISSYLYSRLELDSCVY